MIGRKQLERAKKQYAYCDEVAIAVAIDHDRIVKEAKFLRVTVELHGEVTRGQMAVDWMSQVLPDSCCYSISIFFIVLISRVHKKFRNAQLQN